MQNSLNQAFIRAYAKERDAVHAQAAHDAADSQAAVQRANDELIMRIDTTTVDIPHSHLNTRKPERQAVVAASATTQAAAVQTRPQPTQADELRASIAAEMLRAGGWQSEEIASLSPITSTLAQTPAAEKRAPVATIAEDSEPRPMAFEREPVIDSDRDYTESAATKFYSREATSNRTAPPDFMQYVKSGSIVRLDQPFAPAAPDESLQPAAKKVAQPASKKLSDTETGSNSAARMVASTRDDVASPVSFTPPAFAVHSATADSVRTDYASTMVAARKMRSETAAKQVERELRQAKVRVFNPIWEVDQLQWPEVCLQLMEARMDSLTHVTKHLSDACQEGLQVLAVTSPEGGEGRTTVACCLAMLAGSRGMKVAIVDGDIENPTLCLQTNLEIENDWQSAILNHLPLEEVSVHSIDDQITLVPLLSPVDQSELPNTDQRIADMLIELSESFDLVIIDVGHMNSPGGLMYSLAEQGIINAAIAVVDHRNSSTQRVETCIRRIRQAGVTSIGLVENFAA